MKLIRIEIEIIKTERNWTCEEQSNKVNNKKKKNNDENK